MNKEDTFARCLSRLRELSITNHPIFAEARSLDRRNSFYEDSVDALVDQALHGESSWYVAKDKSLENLLSRHGLKLEAPGNPIFQNQVVAKWDDIRPVPFSLNGHFRAPVNYKRPKNGGG